MKRPTVPSSTSDSARRGYFYRALSLLILAAALSRLLPVAAEQLGTPFGLAYESPNLASIHAIQSGKRIYDPDLYLRPPYTLTMYTPLYLYLVAALPASEEHPFLTGRIVALVAGVSRRQDGRTTD